MSKKSILKAVIVLTLGCSLLAYFTKPKASLLEFVSPKDELPTYEAHFPGNTRLSDRVIKSYALAMVLVQTPFTQNNVTSLEMIREWARDQFQRHPDFLHPVTVIVDAENRDTVFSAIGYNLFAPVKFWLEAQTAQLLKLRIADFHQSGAFGSFAKAYFDFFEKDSDSATMLALYESARAKQAVNVVLWTAVWLSGFVFSLVTLARHRKNDFFGTMQSVVAGVWYLIGTQYLFLAWDNGPSSMLASGVLALAGAVYLTRPFIVVGNQEGSKQPLFVKLAPRWVALAAWLTGSMFTVQVLTWLRTGLPNGSDPITLLLCSISGNFIHEPIAAKRLITGVVAGLWVMGTIWAWRQREKAEPFAVSEDEGLGALDRSVDFQVTR